MTRGRESTSGPGMADFLQTREARIIILGALTAMLIAVGLYIIRRFRPGGEEQKFQSSEMITNFRELYARGQLSEEEYRTIKTKLASKAQDEFKGKEDDGSAD